MNVPDTAAKKPKTGQIIRLPQDTHYLFQIFEAHTLPNCSFTRQSGKEHDQAAKDIIDKPQQMLRTYSSAMSQGTSLDES